MARVALLQNLSLENSLLYSQYLSPRGYVKKFGKLSLSGIRLPLVTDLTPHR